MNERKSPWFPGKEPVYPKQSFAPPVPFALLAVLGWMCGVVTFPDIGEYQCPKL